jgi:large subunit ribosomal protein L10
LLSKDSDLAGLGKYLTGPTAVAISTTDPVAPSKVLAKFAKDFNKLEIKGGMVEGNIIDVDGVKELASTPSKEELLGKTYSEVCKVRFMVLLLLSMLLLKKQEQAESEA